MHLVSSLACLAWSLEIVRNWPIKLLSIHTATLSTPKTRRCEIHDTSELIENIQRFTSSFMMRLNASPNDNVRFLTLSAFLGPFFFFFFLGFSSSSSSSSSSDSSTGIMIWIGARMAPAFSSVWSTSSVFPKYVIGSF